MRVVLRSVGRIITRVVHEQRKSQDLLDGLRRIGIDEISYRKGQRYLVVVVDHDTGRLVRAANGRDADTVRRSFIELGEERCAKIEKVSCDGSAQTSTWPSSTDSSTRVTSHGASRPSRCWYNSMSRIRSSCRSPAVSQSSNPRRTRMRLI